MLALEALPSLPIQLGGHQSVILPKLGHAYSDLGTEPLPSYTKKHVPSGSVHLMPERRTIIPNLLVIATFLDTDLWLREHIEGKRLHPLPDPFQTLCGSWCRCNPDGPGWNKSHRPGLMVGPCKTLGPEAAIHCC